MQRDLAPAPHNVIATFDGMDAARSAISDLERHGIDAVYISLRGPAAVEAEHASASTDTLTTHDARAAGYIARRTISATFIGAVALGIVGFIVGAFIHRPVNVGYVVAGFFAGAIIGSVFGFMLGGTLVLPMSRDWELTFESIGDGRAVVGVHAPDKAVCDSGYEVLRAHEPVSLERYDGRGRRVAA